MVPGTVNLERLIYSRGQVVADIVLQSILLYYFRLDPDNTHDLYLTESIIILARTDTHLLISAPGQQ